MKLNPAEYLIYKIGGVRKTAKLLGRSPSAVCKWPNQGGIPRKLHQKVLDVTTELGIDFTSYDLIYGREISMRDITGYRQ